MNFFVEWSRKKAFKAYYVIEANNALENVGHMNDNAIYLCGSGKG